MIGAWCFVDHYGPDPVSETGGMRVAPHPHTGLQTVSWLFTGEIEHRDSAGHHAMVRPGELNLMTAGRGISHSEVSTPATDVLHGAQLWVALPAADRDADPGFRHYVPPVVEGEGWTARVFLGSLLGSTSPVPTFTPLVGAELLLEPGSALAPSPRQPRRWQPTRCGSKTPVASISANIVVGPTKVNPRRFSAFDSASDSGEVVCCSAGARWARPS